MTKSRNNRPSAVNNELGFIPMMLFFLALLIAGVVFVYMRVMNANQ